MAGQSIGQEISLNRKLSLGLFLFGVVALAPAFAQAQPATSTASGAASKDPIEVQLFGKLTPDSKKGEYADIADAISSLKTGKIEEARNKLGEAAKKNAGLPPASMMLAKILFAANQVPAGRAELEKCVLDNPKDPDAFLVLADIAVQQQEITAADLLFKEAEKITAAFSGNDLRAKDFKVRINAGQAAVLESREKWTEALERLNAWAAADDKAAACHQRMAGVLVHLEKFADALKALEKAAAIDSDMIHPPAVLGIMCQQASLRYTGENKDKESNEKGKKLKAEADLRMNAAFREVAADKSAASAQGEKAEKIKSRNLRCLLAIADFELLTNQIPKAALAAKTAMDLDSKSVEAKIQAGIAARFEKDSKKAESLLTEAVQLSPANFMAVNHLAVVLAEQDRTKEPTKFQRALEYATSNARQYPKSPEAAATLGWVLFKGGDRFNAGKALEAAASSGSLSADSAFYAASILADIGRKEDAVRLLEAADKTTVPFFHREEAETMRKSLEAEVKKEKK